MQGSSGTVSETKEWAESVCSYDVFLLAFLRHSDHYGDVQRAHTSLEKLSSVASRFCDALCDSSELRNHLNAYFAAESVRDRFRPLSAALNAILATFREQEVEGLPKSTNLSFSSNDLGIVGIYDDGSHVFSSGQHSGLVIFSELQSHSLSTDTSPNIPYGEQLASPSSSKCQTRFMPSFFPPQSLKYAQSHISDHPLMNHAIGLVFTDAQVSIWWHDRESTIQSSTIDIETELSKLVVLLVILQRFSRIDWGFSAALESSVDGTTLIAVDKHVFRATIRPEDLGTRRGRGTFTSRVSDVSNPSFDYFMKATFVDAEADGESAIIKKCHELAQGDTVILDHIPKVIAAQTFPELATSRIRRHLNLGSNRSRMPCILVFEQLQPITALPPELLWSAIWDIVRCHFLLWQLGVHHRDISVGNLMYNATTGKGILNDFDIAIILDRDTIPAPCPRTTFGTVPFMALELLAAPQSKSQAFHLYRHDLESFTWTLLWICTGYSHKARSREDPLANVFSDDRVSSLRAK
ncbi:hypothetical protein C8J56DRAFT_479625 [Mycena floridula]|nr:hypothetical protein C8J56DRAFT_479625 [Mycena floridula]